MPSLRGSSGIYSATQQLEDLIYGNSDVPPPSSLPPSGTDLYPSSGMYGAPVEPQYQPGGESYLPSYAEQQQANTLYNNPLATPAPQGQAAPAEMSWQVSPDVRWAPSTQPPPSTSPNMTTAAMSVSPIFDRPRTAPNMTSAAMSVSPPMRNPAAMAPATSPFDAVGSWVQQHVVDPFTQSVAAQDKHAAYMKGRSAGMGGGGGGVATAEEVAANRAAFAEDAAAGRAAQSSRAGTYPPGINAQGGVVTSGGRPAVQGPGLNPSGSIARGGRYSVAGGTFQQSLPSTTPPITEAAGEAMAARAVPPTATVSGRPVFGSASATVNAQAAGRPVFGAAGRGVTGGLRGGPSTTPTPAGPALGDAAVPARGGRLSPIIGAGVVGLAGGAGILAGNYLGNALGGIETRQYPNFRIRRSVPLDTSGPGQGGFAYQPGGGDLRSQADAYNEQTQPGEPAGGLPARPALVLQPDDTTVISERTSDAFAGGTGLSDYSVHVFETDGNGEPIAVDGVASLSDVPALVPDAALRAAVARGQEPWTLGKDANGNDEFAVLVAAGLVPEQSREMLTGLPIMAPKSWVDALNAAEVTYTPVAGEQAAVTDTSGGGGSTWTDYGSSSRSGGRSSGGGGGSYGTSYGGGGYGDYGVPGTMPMAQGDEAWMSRPSPWDIPIFDKFFAVANAPWPPGSRQSHRGRTGRRGMRGLRRVPPRITVNPRVRSTTASAPGPVAPMTSSQEALAAALALRDR